MPHIFSGDFENFGDYDGEFGVAKARLDPGEGAEREGFDTFIHSGAGMIYHPDQPKIVKTRVPWPLLSGSFRFEFKWEEGEFTEEEIEDYINLVSPSLDAGTICVKDMAGRHLYFDTPEVDVRMPEWENCLKRLPWTPYSSYAKIGAVTEARIVCLVIKNNRFDEYSYEQKTIDVNQTLTVDRAEKEKCFVLFTGPVRTTSGKELVTLEPYSLTSQNIEVENTGSERIRVIRLSR